MVYECENCESVLRAGLRACPHCGECFDSPVPDDATLTDDETPPSVSVSAPIPPVRRPTRLPRFALPLAALLLAGAAIMVGALWTAHRGQAPSAPPVSAAISAGRQAVANPLPTDTEAHPSYVHVMNAFVSKLQASGIGAQWPAFGLNDTLLVTPPTVVDGQKAEWNTDLYRQLAQGIYANFWEKRYTAGFSETDSTTCFVLVSDPSGKIVAADLMGIVK